MMKTQKQNKNSLNEDEDYEEIEEDEEGEMIDEIQDELDENEDLQDKSDKLDKKSNKLIDVAHMNVDMNEVNLKIQGIVDILSDFRNKKDESKCRNDYITELKQLLIIYYDYNEDLINLILYLFAPNEAVEFLESNNTQRVVTIRTNTLKTKRRELAKALIQRGVNLDPLAEWSKVGLKVYDSQVPVGATPEYLCGYYMLQSGSSFLPVLALAPGENEKILDMAAAPGGKSTYIAQMMKNTGVLVANDLKKERIKSLYFNIHRLGIKNAIITNYDGRKIQKAFSSFDRVLLDAPCSGLGVISKDQSIKLNRTYKDIIQTTRIQKELLLAAIDCCSHKSKTGGIIVYSTCSITVEENEWVVDYALKHRYVKVVETGIFIFTIILGFEIGEPGFTSFRDRRFHPSLRLTKRIYPHLHNMDGFFVAKLQKYADGSKTVVKQGNAKKKKTNNKGDVELVDENEENVEVLENNCNDNDNDEDGIQDQENEDDDFLDTKKENDDEPEIEELINKTVTHTNSKSKNNKEYSKKIDHKNQNNDDNKFLNKKRNKKNDTIKTDSKIKENKKGKKSKV